MHTTFTHSTNSKPAVQHITNSAPTSPDKNTVASRVQTPTTPHILQPQSAETHIYSPYSIIISTSSKLANVIRSLTSSERHTKKSHIQQSHHQPYIPSAPPISQHTLQQKLLSEPGLEPRSTHSQATAHTTKPPPPIHQIEHITQPSKNVTRLQQSTNIVRKIRSIVTFHHQQQPSNNNTSHNTTTPQSIMHTHKHIIHTAQDPTIPPRKREHTRSEKIFWPDLAQIWPTHGCFHMLLCPDIDASTGTTTSQPKLKTIEMVSRLLPVGKSISPHKTVPMYNDPH